MRPATPSVVRIRKPAADHWTEYTSTIPATAHEMKIPSLDPNTVYEYQVDDAEGKSTPPPVVVATGDWFDSTPKSALPGLSGKGSRASDNQTGNAVARIAPPINAKGLYLISITTPNLSAAEAGDKWLDVGLLEIAPGDAFTLLEVEDEPGRFYFDAVKFTRHEPANPGAK